MNDYDLDPSKWDALITSILQRFLSFTKNDILIDSLDLRQEAWIALMQASKRYDATKARFTTFAYHYIVGHLMRYVRRNTMQIPKTTPLETDDDTEYLVEPEYIDQIALQDARDVLLEKISGHQHYDIFCEYFIEGKSYRKIAANHGVSYETIALRIRRLIEILNARMSYENH
jgi:RNA polymerase sigma factor (sigma-70 family)